MNEYVKDGESRLLRYECLMGRAPGEQPAAQMPKQVAVICPYCDIKLLNDRY